MRQPLGGPSTLGGIGGIQTLCNLSHFTLMMILPVFRPEDIADLLIELIEDDTKNGADIKIHKVEGKVVREEATFRDQPLNECHPGSEEISATDGAPGSGVSENIKQ